MFKNWQGVFDWIILIACHYNFFYSIGIFFYMFFDPFMAQKISKFPVVFTTLYRYKTHDNRHFRIVQKRSINHFTSDIAECIVNVRVIFLLMKIVSVKWTIKNNTSICQVNFLMVTGKKNPYNLVISKHALYNYHEFFFSNSNFGRMS